MAIQTWVVYQFKCFRSFRWGDYCVSSDAQAVDCADDTAVLVISYFFTSGVGLNMLGASTFLKVLDMIVNLMIPTPTICREEDEQRDYEFRNYTPPLAAPPVAEEMEREGKDHGIEAR